MSPFEKMTTHGEIEDTIVAGDRVVRQCLYSWGDGPVRAADLYRVGARKITRSSRT
jgi:hypothetical protein